MPYYRMIPVMPEKGTVLTKSGSPLALYKTGHLMEDFTPPMQLHMGALFQDGTMSTFYTTPAFIGTKQFYDDLCECGIDNIEVYPAVIEDIGNEREIKDYLLLNVLGRIACADLDQCDTSELIPGFQLIDELVIRKGTAGNRYMFLVDEDTNCIIVAEHVKNHLESKGYSDIAFIEVPEV